MHIRCGLLGLLVPTSQSLSTVTATDELSVQTVIPTPRKTPFTLLLTLCREGAQQKGRESPGHRRRDQTDGPLVHAVEKPSSVGTVMLQTTSFTGTGRKFLSEPVNGFPQDIRLMAWRNWMCAPTRSVLTSARREKACATDFANSHSLG